MFQFLSTLAGVVKLADTQRSGRCPTKWGGSSTLPSGTNYEQKAIGNLFSDKKYQIYYQKLNLTLTDYFLFEI